MPSGITPCGLLEGWLRVRRRARPRRNRSPRMPSGRGSHSTALLERGERLSVRRRRRRERRRRRAFRPNQLLAISLDHPVLDQERWQPVLRRCANELLTPVGLRSLAPGQPDYKAKYDRRSAGPRRGLSSGDGLGLADRALHRRVVACSSGRSGRGPPLAGRLRRPSRGSVRRLHQRGLRCGAAVHAARLLAQAWSVAEVLRCWAKTAD